MNHSPLETAGVILGGTIIMLIAFGLAWQAIAWLRWDRSQHKRATEAESDRLDRLIVEWRLRKSLRVVDSLYPGSQQRQGPWPGPGGCSYPPCDLEERWWCRTHCKTCTVVSSCLGHDMAWAIEMDRRLAQ